MPKSVRDRVKPNPMPIPSTIEARGVFFEAKDSALPRIIQLTTIRGINIPRLSYSAGTYASIIIPVIVTKVAATTMNAGILTCFGAKSFIRDITRLEHINTKAVASPCPLRWLL